MQFLIGLIGGVIGGAAWRVFDWWKQQQYEAKLQAARGGNAREKKPRKPREKKNPETPLPL